MTDISDVKKFEEPDAKRYPGPGAEFFAAGGFAMDLRHDYAHVLASGRERDINPSRATEYLQAMESRTTGAKEKLSAIRKSAEKPTRQTTAVRQNMPISRGRGGMNE